MNKAKIFSNLLIFALVAVAFVYMGYQVVAGFLNPVEAVRTTYVTAQESIAVEGFLVFEERLIDKPSGASARVTRFDGERVSKGSVVALVYRDESAIQVNNTIEDLTKRLDVLAFVQNRDDHFSAANIESDISQALIGIAHKVSTKNLQKLPDDAFNLKALVLKQHYLFQPAEVVGEEMTRINSQVNQLKASGSDVISRVYAPMSGFFQSYVDGLENTLTPGTVDMITPEQYAQAVQAKPKSIDGVLGKMLDGFTWFYVTMMDNDQIKDLDPKKSLRIRFNQSDDRTVNATVRKIIPAQDGQNIVILQSADYMGDISLMRHQYADIIIKDVSGLRVPKNALRVNDQGEQGVYCLTGTQAVFRKVEILFQKENYVLVKYDEKNKNGLLPNDQVIVKGKYLEDSKIVR